MATMDEARLSEIRQLAARMLPVTGHIPDAVTLYYKTARAIQDVRNAGLNDWRLLSALRFLRDECRQSMAALDYVGPDEPDDIGDKDMR